MTNFKVRGFRRVAGLFCVAAILAVTTPVKATIDVSGGDPVSRWLHSIPPSCSFFRPSESYWVGAVMNDDWKQFPKNGNEQSIMQGIASIRAFYDPVHKIAAFYESGTDTLNYAVIGGAAPPPTNAKVTTIKDLSSVILGGNVRLGQTVAQVSSAVGLKSLLHPSAAPSCPGYSAVGFCSWNRTGCVCILGPVSGPEKKFGVAVFHEGRVVALGWDDGECGFG